MAKLSSAWLTYLHLTIERGQDEASSDFFENTLRIVKDHLCSYRKASVDKAIQTDAPEKFQCFLKETCCYLDIEKSQCIDLLLNYFKVTSPCSSARLDCILSDEKNRRSLMFQLYDYYLTDRIFILKCLITIVKMRISGAIMPDEFQLVGKSDYLRSVVQAYADCVKLPLSSEANQDGNKLNRFTQYRFYFQREFIRFLIWHIHSFDFSLDLVVDVLDVLTIHRAKESRTEWNSELGLLEIVLYVKLFDIDLLVKDVEMTERCAPKSCHSVWATSSKEEIKAAEDSFESYLNVIDHLRSGPLCLFWCLNKQMRAIVTDCSTDQKATQLGTMARKLRVFAVLVRLVKSDVLQSDKDLWDITCASLISIIDSFLSFYDPHLIGENDSFNTLIRRLMENSFVAEEFWAQGFSEKSNTFSYFRRSMLERFPLLWHASLNAAVSLCRSSTKSCKLFIDWFQKLSTFCEKLNCTSILNSVHVIDEFTCKSLIDRSFSNYGDFVVPAGSIGRIVELTGDEIVISWCVPSNGWQLLLLKMETDERRGTIDVQNYALIFELVEAALKSDANSSALLVHFLRKAVAVLKTPLNLDEKENARLLTLCLSTLSYCNASYSFEIFNELCDVLLDISAADFSLFLHDQNSGLLGQFLNQIDRQLGSYDFSLAFFRLMLNCAKNEEAQNDERFAAHLSYIVDYVFVNFPLWNFSVENCRACFVVGCLKVLHKAVEMMTLKRNYQFSRLPLASEVCCRSLLYGEAKDSLISIIVDGSRILSDLWHNFENERGTTDLVQQTSLAISIVIQLLDVSLFTAVVDRARNKPSQNTLRLPPLLLSLYMKDNKANEAFLISLTSLLNNRLSFRLPKLALLCLHKFAELFPSSLLYGLGPHVDQFRDIFLCRLAHCPGTAGSIGDIELHISCFNFLATCARFQSGLLQKLTYSEDETLEFKPPLKIQFADPYTVAFDIIKSERVQPNLLLACVNFLTVCIRFGSDWPERISTDLQFWTCLCAPLACGESEFFLKICCQIFDLLAAILTNSKNEWPEKIEPEIRLVVEKTFKNSTENIDQSGRDDRLELLYKKFGELFDSDLDLIEDKLCTFEKWTRFLTACVKRGNGDWFGEKASFDIAERTMDLHIKFVETSTYRECSQASGCLGDLSLLFVSLCSKWHENSPNWPKIATVASQLVNVVSHVDISRNFENLLWAPYSVWMISLLHTDANHCSPDAPMYNSLNSTISLLTKFLTRDSVLLILEKETPESVQKIVTLLMMSVTACISKLNDETWLPVIKRQFLFHNIAQYLKFQLENRFRSTDVLITTFALFARVFVNAEAASSVRSSGLFEFICGQLPETVSADDYVNSSADNAKWQRIFSSLLDFYDSACLNVPDVVFLELPKFQMSWEEYFIKIADQSFTKPTLKSLQCLLKVCLLLRNIAIHEERLRLKFSRSLKFVVDYISAICAKSIEELIKPRFVDDSIVKADGSKEIDPDSTLTKQELKRINSSVLGVCLQILIEFSPPLKSMVNQVVFDFEACKSVCLPDFSTIIHPDDSKRLTFGHLLLCMQLCTTSLRKSDARLSSPSARASISHPLSAQQIDKREVFHFLESAAYLYLTQGVLQINQLKDRDFSRSATLERELATELGLVLSKFGRQSGSPGLQRRSPALALDGKSALGLSSPATAAFLVFNMDFLLSMRDFVDSMLRR